MKKILFSIALCLFVAMVATGQQSYNTQAQKQTFVTTIDGRRITQERFEFEQRCAANANKQAALDAETARRQAQLDAERDALIYQESANVKASYKTNLEAYQRSMVELDLDELRKINEIKEAFALARSKLTLEFKVKFEYTAPPVELTCKKKK